MTDTVAERSSEWHTCFIFSSLSHTSDDQRVEISAFDKKETCAIVGGLPKRNKADPLTFAGFGFTRRARIYHRHFVSFFPTSRS